jgi:murein DD-endopeptidase MepM/ murein hydrolase activator NlpD
MPKVKYYYDAKSLSYQRVERTWKIQVRNSVLFIVASAFFAALILFVGDKYFDSPKERQLRQELEFMQDQYALLNRRLSQMDEVLRDMSNRDDNIYRVIFEAEPIPQDIRRSGFGGANRYKSLEGFDNSNLIKEAARKTDIISKQMYVQSRSLDEVVTLAKKKAEMLQSIPAIQPVANKDLTRVASGYGYRIHPIYKVRKLHTGIDFTAPTGTPVYATGDGRVIFNSRNSSGYGLHVVIDHGYGYQTLYAHLSKVEARAGARIKRGEILGYIGNTGTSTAPHLHYEVIKGGNKVNPINFFFNDLSPEEFALMTQLSSQENQSFD